MSAQRKKGCSDRQAPEEHRLRVQAGSVLAGRQAGTAAQGIIMAAVPSCPSLPFGPLSLPIQPSPRENKAQPQWATECGGPTVCASQAPPRKGEQGSQRCCIGAGHAVEAAGPAWLEGDGRGCQRGEEALMDGSGEVRSIRAEQCQAAQGLSSPV